MGNYSCITIMCSTISIIGVYCCVCLMNWLIIGSVILNFIKSPLIRLIGNIDVCCVMRCVYFSVHVSVCHMSMCVC